MHQLKKFTCSLVIMIVLLSCHHSQSLSLRDLIPWSRSVDAENFEANYAYLRTQIGKRRLGCQITAKSINFTDPDYYSGEDSDDLDECMVKDASALYAVLNKTKLGKFEMSKCKRSFDEVKKLYECIQRAVDDLEIMDTPVYNDLKAFKGRQEWFGCAVDIFPWQNGFYTAKLDDQEEINTSIEEILDSLSLCTKSDSLFMHNVLFGVDGQLSYEAAPGKRGNAGVKKCARSEQAENMLECIQNSALKFNRFRDIVESKRPLCNNPNLWVTSFLHSQSQHIDEFDSNGKQLQKAPKLSIFESEFRYDFFMSTQESKLAELVENYKISLKIESVKMLECLAENPIPARLFSSLDYRPVRMHLSKILGRNTNELLTTFILVLLGLTLILVIATWIYVLAKRSLKRRKMMEERKSAVENMRTIVF